MAQIKVTQSVGRPLKALAPIRDWAIDVGDWVYNYMQSNDRVASRRSIDSLEVEVTKPNEVVLKGANSVRYALAGRRGFGAGAGKETRPPIRAIEDWIIHKGIQPSPSPSTGRIPSLTGLAFAIAHKINELGTNPPKLRAQNIELVINQKGEKHLIDLSQLAAQEASDAMVKFLTKNIPNTTKK